MYITKVFPGLDTLGDQTRTSARVYSLSKERKLTVYSDKYEAFKPLLDKLLDIFNLTE